MISVILCLIAGVFVLNIVGLVIVLVCEKFKAKGFDSKRR